MASKVKWARQKDIEGLVSLKRRGQRSEYRKQKNLRLRIRSLYFPVMCFGIILCIFVVVWNTKGQTQPEMMKKMQEWVFLSHQSSVIVHHPLFRHSQKNLNAF